MHLAGGMPPNSGRSTAVAEAGMINPSAVIMGFSETLTSTIPGLTVLIVAAPVRFVLYARCWSLRAVGPHDNV